MLLTVIVILVLMIPLTAIVLDSQLGKAMASRLERTGRARPKHASETDRRLEMLEGEVERLSAELAQVSEENRFLAELVRDPSGTAGDLPRESGGR